MIRYELADLYNTTELFFGKETRVWCTLSAFLSDMPRQNISIICIKEFCRSDQLFRVIGDMPLTFLTPPDIRDFLQNIAKVMPATLNDRIRSNVLVRWAIWLKYFDQWKYPWAL